MSRPRRDPSFSAPVDRLVNRDRIEGISEARAGIRLKTGARTGRQATQIERLNSMDTGEVSLEFSRQRGNTEWWGGAHTPHLVPRGFPVVASFGCVVQNVLPGDGYGTYAASSQLDVRPAAG